MIYNNGYSTVLLTKKNQVIPKNIGFIIQHLYNLKELQHNMKIK